MTSAPQLEATPLRTYEDVRSRIDSKLGAAVSVSSVKAASQLEPVEHVVWLLDNLLVHLFEGSLHLFDQGFAGDSGYDGPRIVSAIAEVARPLNGTVADLLRWSMHWLETRGVALVSIVPDVWASQMEPARRFLFELAARWPDALEPTSLAAPAPYVRAGATGRIEVGFTARGSACLFQCPPARQHREGVFQAVAWALWAGGAPDDTVEDFFHRYFERSAVEAEVVAQFVSIDGDGGDVERLAALQSSIRPRHPLAQWLGVDEVPNPCIIRASTLGDFENRFGQWSVRTLEGPDLAKSARAALRTDPDVLLFDATLLKPADEEIFIAACQTGHLLAAGGHSAVMDGLLARLAEQGVKVFDRAAV